LLPFGLLPHLDYLVIENVIVREREVVIVVAAREPTAPCPICTRRSDRFHSEYLRTLHDLPIGPNTVVLRVRVRRFRCSDRHCRQRTFAERFPGLGRVRARRTHGQQAALEEIGIALGGTAGASLARKMRLPTSGSTILRLVRARKDPSAPTPRVLGVDDWARLRGQTYGTILVDLERHRPIDLLEDRTAETLAQWLREHPGVEVIARDRAGAYADGARRGAPTAIQVADRFHLVVNVGDALERVLSRKHSVLKAVAALDQLAGESGQAATQTTMSSTSRPAAPAAANHPTRQNQLKQARRSRRLERYEAVLALDKLGLSRRAIGRELGISRNTVKRFLQAGDFPERAEGRPKPTILLPFEAYLRERWTAGCHNARTLWEGIRRQGFPGSAALVRQFVAHWRPSPGRRGPTPRQAVTEALSPTPPVRKPTRAISPRQARWLLLRAVDKLAPEEQLLRDKLLAADVELAGAKSLAEEFGQIVRRRDRLALEPWLERAEGSGISEFRQFAIVLRRDIAAVKAALSLIWSNGQTEGQINRLKVLKRQMYGRASLLLLKRRFLRAA
jgi:transposase